MDIKELIGKPIDYKDGVKRRIVKITQEERNLLEERQQVTRVFNVLYYQSEIVKGKETIWSDTTGLILNGSPLCQLFIKNLGL